jgi:uncharacterized membrane protein YccF (DUF307 family)
MSIEQQTTSTLSIQRENSPGCLIQALWFIFIGWWLGAISIIFAWFLNITIIGLPLGMAILNNIPMILALQSPKREIQAARVGGNTVIIESRLRQHNFVLRMIYFLLIGWWWSAIWLAIAYLLCATIILIPIGLKMFRLTPFMTTLKRY